MKSIVLLLVLSLAIIGGCNNNPSAPASPDVIIPLAAGNRWIYNEYSVDAGGNKSLSGSDTIIITAPQKINDISSYGYELKRKTKDPYDMGVITYCFNTSAGFYYNLVSSTLVYEFPGKTGDSFISSYGLADILASNVTLTIPAGTFICYKYSFKRTDNIGINYEEIHYCCPNKGIIKLEYYSGSAQAPTTLVKTSESELKEYIIK